jgi:hypothetical protein
VTNKILIIPVGLYIERVWKSIVRSGADKIYLITDSKPEYEVTEEAASEIEKRIQKANLIAKVTKKKADLSSRQEVYKILIAIIERERAENPYIRTIIDLTSTTKVLMLAASNLAGAYGIMLTYTPGTKKLSKTFIRELYQVHREDLGGEVQEIEPVFSIPEGNPLTKDEIRILHKLDQGAYPSIIQLIRELADQEGIEKVVDAYEKNMLRTIRELERKGLTKSRELGRTKQIELSDVGKGVVMGLNEAEQALEKDHLQPLLQMK